VNEKNSAGADSSTRMPMVQEVPVWHGPNSADCRRALHQIKCEPTPLDGTIPLI